MKCIWYLPCKLKKEKKKMRFIRSFKLSDWCLRVIADNLNLFMHNETVPPKHIDFLFRLYSEELYHQYSNQNSMTDECTLWFLNPHNKKITLHYITENIISRLQVVGSGITSLTLYESLASEWILNSVVCCIPNVTYLDLSSSHCSDSTLLCIQRMCPDLVTLKIRGCRAITSRGLEYLHGNHSIRNLNILDCNITFGLITVLQGIPSLQCLAYENLSESLYYIHEDDFKTGAYKTISYNLTELDLNNYDIGNFTLRKKALQIIWAWTVLCPYVKKVNFNFPMNHRTSGLITESVLWTVLDMCNKFKNLEELKIQMLPNPYYNTTVAEIYSTPVLSFSYNIRKLSLSLVKISIVVLLENFKNLKVLHLKCVYFSDFKQEMIKIQETKLETLVIKYPNLEFSHTSYRAISLLISLSKNVTHLYLNHIRNLSQELLYVIINSMKKLFFVDFSFSIVTLNSLNCFFKMPSLRVMYCDLCTDLSLNEEDHTIKSLLSESICTLSWRILTDNDYDHDTFSNVIE